MTSDRKWMLADGTIVPIYGVPTAGLIQWLSDRVIEPGVTGIPKIRDRVISELERRGEDRDSLIEIRGTVRAEAREDRLARLGKSP